MVNQSVNEFYTRFLFEIDAIPQDGVLTLYIATTFFNNLSTDVRELLISKGVQVPPRPPTETNYQGNQRLFLVRNLEVEAENNIRTTKTAVQPARGSLHPSTFMGILGVNPSIKMDSLGRSFKFEEYKYIMSEAQE